MVMVYSKNLFCKKHMEDDIKKKLTDLHMKTEQKRKILEDIFGNEIESKIGLVDSADAKEFEHHLNIHFYSRWDELEGGNKFTSYFKTYIFEDISSGMLANV